MGLWIWPTRTRFEIQPVENVCPVAPSMTSKAILCMLDLLHLFVQRIKTGAEHVGYRCWVYKSSWGRGETATPPLTCAGSGSPNRTHAAIHISTLRTNRDCKYRASISQMCLRSKTSKQPLRTLDRRERIPIDCTVESDFPEESP